VCAYCDPVFVAAQVGFVRHVQPQPNASGAVAAILWEADPSKFAAKYPDSDIVESYGEEHWGGVSRIDFWLYVDADDEVSRLSVEGWNLPDILVKASGHCAMDGMSIPAIFARILGVRDPLRA
jgi:hypothetical protein